MIAQNESGWLVVVKHGRTVPIQKVNAQAGVEALLRLGYSEDVAQVFGNGAERSKVVALSQRKRVIQ